MLPVNYIYLEETGSLCSDEALIRSSLVLNDYLTFLIVPVPREYCDYGMVSALAA